MKLSASLLLLLALVSGSAAAAAPNMGPDSALRMFVGSWQSHGSLTAPGAKKPTRVTGANDCRWSSDTHLFLVCNGVAHIEGIAAPQYQLSIYTYDAASGKYRFAASPPTKRLPARISD